MTLFVFLYLGGAMTAKKIEEERTGERLGNRTKG